MFKKILLPFLIAFSLCNPAVGDVNVKTGNFYITYRDVWLPGDTKLEFRRTYNSVAKDVGWLGAGWGSLFETRLVIEEDGGAYVLENGTGSRTTYVKASKGTPLSSSAHAHDEWTTNMCASGSLTRDEQGFIRVGCDDSADQFSADGFLLSKRYSDGEILAAQWGPNKRPAEIKDGKGNTLVLDWNPEGLLASVSAGADRVMSYTYDAAHYLAHTSGHDREPAYKYSYSKAGLLSGIHFIDTTSRQMEYDTGGRLTTLVGREGERDQYIYSLVKGYPSLVETTVIKTDRNGVNNGSLHYRWNTKFDKATLIDLGDHTLRYQYDRAGRLIKAGSSKGITATIRYLRGDRIARIERSQQGTSKQVLLFKYAKGDKPISVELQGAGVMHFQRQSEGSVDQLSGSSDQRVSAQIVETIAEVQRLARLSGSTGALNL